MTKETKVVLYKDKLGNSLVYNDSGDANASLRYSLDVEAADAAANPHKEKIGMWLEPQLTGSEKTYRRVQAIARDIAQNTNKNEIDRKVAFLLQSLIGRGYSATKIVQAITIPSQQDTAVAQPVSPVTQNTQDPARATAAAAIPSETKSTEPLYQDTTTAWQALPVIQEARDIAYADMTAENISNEEFQTRSEVFEMLEAILTAIKSLLGIQQTEKKDTSVEEKKNPSSVNGRYRFMHHISDPQPPAPDEEEEKREKEDEVQSLTQ